jgi:hypothetical protein
VAARGGRGGRSPGGRRRQGPGHARDVGCWSGVSGSHP